ncbi:MAG: peroxiredoxin [Terriglobia bacterium]|jgi:peroxiredoxin Q/BCP
MALFGTSATLKVGDPAPDFSLSDQNGQLVKLADFRGKKAVVLAFYPRASTSGCTREVKAYQGDIAKFVAAGAQVLGISLDSQERNRKFAEQTGASFPLLCDTEKQVAKAYSVLNFTHLFANRVTFVIDKEGIIRRIDKGIAALHPSNAFQACSLPGKQ